MKDIVVIAHNLRSCNNVGSLLRTAEGIGVSKVFLTGYTPFPRSKNDPRLPHLADKIDRQISKTALGAHHSLPWEHEEHASEVIRRLKTSGYEVCALEQGDKATALHEYNPPDKVALLLGNEVSGIDSQLLTQCSRLVEIPMLGKKESFNVVQAAAMALYHCRFISNT